jgi:ABC-type nickel/cobalt efflux system permease component RcnA
MKTAITYSVFSVAAVMQWMRDKSTVLIAAMTIWLIKAMITTFARSAAQLPASRSMTNLSVHPLRHEHSFDCWM